MTFAMSDITRGLSLILRDPDLHSVTVFCRPKNPDTIRIRITRSSKNSYVLTHGKPNYRERAFLKLCRKAKCHPRKVWCHYRAKRKK